MSPPQFKRMRLNTKNEVKYIPTEQLLTVFDDDIVTFIGKEQALLSLLLFFLPLPLFQDLPIPYIPPPYGTLCTPSPWYQICAKEVGMPEKELPNKSRNLQRNVMENLVKEEYFMGSIGLKTISGMK